jgi:hypothetical protein
MQRQMAVTLAFAMFLVLVVAVLGLVLAEQKDLGGTEADGDSSAGGGSDYVKRTAVMRDALSRLVGDARRQIEHGDGDSHLSEAAAALETWRASLSPAERRRSSAELVEATYRGLTTYAATTQSLGVGPHAAPRLRAAEADLRSLDEALAAGR